MSVINQVLNQLEQRGAPDATEQTMVRAVSRPRASYVLPLLLAVLLLAGGVAAWQWLSLGRPTTANNISASAGHLPTSGEPLQPDQMVGEAIAPASGVLAGNISSEPIMPASRLSFELSSVPLPSALRQGLGRAEKADSSKRSVLSAQPGAGVSQSKTVSKPKHPATTKTAGQTKTTGNAVPIKQVSAAQRADAEFRRAAGLMQLGRIADAIAGYEAALSLDAGHEAARQALVALLLENKRSADAEKVLQEGLRGAPEHTGFTMLLARLQVERGALTQATATLEKSLQFANEQADYYAFLAALLQRQNRNEEAIKHYQAVLRNSPSNGVWLMGYGISLQAMQRNTEAKEMFQRALDAKTLSPELQAFVRQKLKEL